MLDGQLSAASPELRAVAQGALDLAGNRFRGMRLGIDLLKPPALFPNMTGKGVRMVWTLDGPFATADYSYRLTSDYVQFDNTGFTDLHAEGRGQLGAVADARADPAFGARRSPASATSPGRCSPTRRIEGWLTVTPKLVRGDGLKLTSAKWNGKMSLLIDLVTGRFEVTLSGAMQRYLIPGLGIVDVITDLKVVPGPNNKGSHVVGTAKAWVRRLDNSFFREPDRRPAVADHQPRARQRRDRPFHQPAALFAQAAAVGRGPALQGRHLPHRRGRPAGEIRAGEAGPRRPYRAAPARPAARPAQRRARHHARCGCCSIRPRPASTIAPAAARGSGRSPATGRSCFRTNAPTVIAIAALDAGGAHASGNLALRSGRVHAAA